uniref:Uncharacterized protein n=1 Tax=Ovis aries TaxID=9940 RepID=A0AC11EUV1_SHEEP
SGPGCRFRLRSEVAQAGGLGRTGGSGSIQVRPESGRSPGRRCAAARPLGPAFLTASSHTQSSVSLRFTAYRALLPAQHPPRCRDNMPTAKQLADIGYKTFSTSMMLLTVYGGYLCSVRAYHYFQRRSSQRQAAEEQKTSGAL